MVIKYIGIITILIGILFPAWGRELTYSGRLVQANGAPVTGIVDLKFDLAYSGSPGTPVCTKTIDDVPLSNGLFHVNLSYENTDCLLLKSLSDVLNDVPATESVVLQVTDVNRNKTYPHQALKSVPYSIQALQAQSLANMGATAGQILKWDGSKWAPDDLDASSSGTVSQITTGSGLTGGPITTTGSISIATGGVTSTHLADGTIMNTDISGTADIARSKIAAGPLNQVVINSAVNGELTSVSQLSLILGGTGASNATDARANLGLGSAAVLSVGSGTGNLFTIDTVPSCNANQKLQMNDLLPVYSWSCVPDLDSPDPTKLPLSGGTMSGSINMGTNSITNLTDPVNAQDAATRNYVHTYVSSQVSGITSSQWLTTGSNIYFSNSVGIGTSTIGSGTKLNVEGQIKTGSGSITTGSVNWNVGNVVTTSFDCGSNITFQNLRDGASYTLIVTGAGTTQCNFNTAVTGDDSATVTYRFKPANGARTASTHTIYSILRAGSVVYVSWIAGF